MKKTALFGVLLMSILNAQAQPPFLDSTFGAGGRQTFALTGTKILNAIAADTNDCLYAAGYFTTNSAANTSIMLTKSKYNGTPDNTFGNQGIVTANFSPAQQDYLSTVAITQGQRVIAGGYTTIGTTRNALLTRYKQNGTPDSTFGTNGVVTTPTGTSTEIAKLVLQNDGKIIAVGTSRTQKPAVWVARYNTDGSLDATFGTGGIDTIHNTATSSDTAITVAIQQPGGKIIVGGMTGTTFSSGGGSMMLLRLNADGSLDNTFGTNGFTVFTNNLLAGLLRDITILTDGSIITTDYRGGSNSSVRPFVKKFSANGVFDATFNNTSQANWGMVYDFAPGTMNIASTLNALVATADGGLIAAGARISFGGSDPAIIKLKANGTYDSTFGVNGLMIGDLPTPPSLWRRAVDVLIQKDGKIGIVAGTEVQSNRSELNRYTNIPLYLGPDRSICQGSSTTLNAQNAGSTYLWNTGATTQTIAASDSGNYYVRVTNPKGSVTDTIHITYHPQPLVQLGNDTTICYGNTITLNAQNAGASYLWSNGATSQTITTNTGGAYSVQVTNSFQCVGRDTLQLTVNPSPVIVSLGADTAFCYGNALTLDAQNAGASYLWSTGATTQTISAATSGVYSAIVTDANQCKGFDTIQVTIHPLPDVLLGNDTAFCAGNILDAGSPGSAGSYQWNTGAISQMIPVLTSGTYYVTVVNLNSCVGSDTIQVTAYPLPVVDLGNDTLHAVNGTIITLDAGNPGAGYLWSDGGATQTHNVINTGMYSVIVTNTDGCSASDSVYVIFDLVGIDSPVGGKEKLTISPNPVMEAVTINIGELTALLHKPVSIIDATGRVVKTIILDKKVGSYTLADLPAGIYFLKTAQGGNYKIVKR